MARSNDAKVAGAPRWTYAAGSLVAIAGLIWAIASYFIPKPESNKPPSPVAASATNVNVSGSGNVGVGTMAGGQISIVTPPTPSKEASAP